MDFHRHTGYLGTACTAGKARRVEPHLLSTYDMPPWPKYAYHTQATGSSPDYGTCQPWTITTALHACRYRRGRRTLLQRPQRSSLPSPPWRDLVPIQVITSPASSCSRTEPTTIAKQLLEIPFLTPVFHRDSRIPGIMMRILCCPPFTHGIPPCIPISRRHHGPTATAARAVRRSRKIPSAALSTG